MPLQPQMDDAVGKAQELDVASVRFQIRADLLQGRQHAAFGIDRVQVVEQQQAGDQFIARPGVDQRSAGNAQVGDVLDHLGKRLAVELQQVSDQLLDLPAKLRIGQFLGLVDQ